MTSLSAVEDDVKQFLISKEGSVLLAWRKWFSTTEEVDHGKLTRADFAAVLRQIGHAGNVEELVCSLDEADTGFVTLNKIDKHSDDLWISFTKWCAITFGNEQEMIEKLSNTNVHARGDFIHSSQRSTGKPKGNEKAGITKAQFINNAARLGWYGAHEALLFSALDPQNTGKVTAETVQWFDREKQKELRRTATKKRGKRGSLLCMRSKVHSQQSLQAFIGFLKIKFGCLFRAWRKVIDRDGDMFVERKELFQACKILEWNGDVLALWKALDADDSGTTTLDELAIHVARPLALFKRWADKNFGNSKAMFKALNSVDHTKLRVGHFDLDDWVDACAQLGCPCDADEIFRLLDWERRDQLSVHDVRCLDKWTPEEYLMSDPNPQAAEELKKQFLKKYKHWLSAWRNGIDRDGCGRCSWTEFKQAAAKVMFTGDVAGAWLHLDNDCSGYVTLAELDKGCSDCLSEFRRWAQHEYGSVLLGFESLLPEGVDALTRKEFRKQTRVHGYKGNADALFMSLDTDGSGGLGRSEVAFLDDWELADMEEHFATNEILEQQEVGKPRKRSESRSDASILLKLHPERFTPVVGNRLLQMVGLQVDADTMNRPTTSPVFTVQKEVPDFLQPFDFGVGDSGLRSTPRCRPQGLDRSSNDLAQAIRWRRPRKLPKPSFYAGGLPYAKKSARA